MILKKINSNNSIFRAVIKKIIYPYLLKIDVV